MELHYIKSTRVVNTLWLEIFMLVEPHRYLTLQLSYKILYACMLCLFLCLPVRLFACLFACLSVCLSVCTCTRLSPDFQFNIFPPTSSFTELSNTTSQTSRHGNRGLPRWCQTTIKYWCVIFRLKIYVGDVQSASLLSQQYTQRATETRSGLNWRHKQRQRTIKERDGGWSWSG